MLNFGNKEFRNLQEQVLKNAQDIETLKGRENLQIVIVEELSDVGKPNYIYLVPNEDGEESNVYNEYIWLADEEAYEQIGAVNIDLTNYVTTDTEQTISGTKTFATAIFTSISNDTFKDSAGNTRFTWSTSGFGYFNAHVLPSATNTRDIGSSSYAWKDLYLSGDAYFSSGKGIKCGGVKTIWFYNAGTHFGTNANPISSNTYDLGTSTYYWKDLYLTGNISDGVHTVSVANIASKVTSTFISGTFDSNGESTIDTEQAGTPEGLLIFTYGNCQCFLRLTATMVQNADTTPIRVACPMIYNSGTVNGWLNITKSGYILILKITDGTNHVDSGYVWTLTKTNLI